MSEEEIVDFLRLSPIYDRLSENEKKALLEEVKVRYSERRQASDSASPKKSKSSP